MTQRLKGKYLIFTKDFLYEQYVVCGKSIRTICSECGITNYTKIGKLLKQYDIDLRPTGSHCVTSLQSKVDKILSIHPYATRDFMFEQYVTNGKSLPDLLNEYGINYDQTQKLLLYYNIEKRSISEAAHTQNFKNKLHATLREKWGVIDNISQSQAIKEKKVQSCLTRFNVDNFFKHKGFLEVQHNGYIRKYGMSKSEYHSQRVSKLWSSLTVEERNIWLEKSIHSKSAQRKLRGVLGSKGESRISDMLNSLEITHTRQYSIEYRDQCSKKRRFFYDIYIPQLNLIIEYNGDFWHANPRIYNANDIMAYPGGPITAKERWQAEANKLDLAKKTNHNIIVIWESEVCRLRGQALLDFIKLKIYENCLQ